MNQIKRNTIIKCSALAVSFLIISCEKESQPIIFTATYDSHTTTKASQPFPAGNKATIFAYTSDSSPSTASMVAGTPLEVTAQNNGILTPVSPLYLPKGTYDFYSVSTNNSITPALKFTNGISGMLSNETDYLWASHSSVQEGGVVTFSYRHSATLVEFNISAGTGISSLQVTSIKFTPSKPESGSIMELSTGTITPSSQKDIPTTITLSGNTGKYIMLPLQTHALDVEVTINAIIGETPVTGKIYTATIPSQSYNEGTHYTINMSVTASSLSFTGSLIEDWTTRTISGISLEEQ